MTDRCFAMATISQVDPDASVTAWCTRPDDHEGPHGTARLSWPRLDDDTWAALQADGDIEIRDEDAR